MEHSSLNKPYNSLIPHPETKLYLQQEGRLIFIGSLMGRYPHSLSISYGVSKAEVHTMAKYLVKEFSPRKITVNVIAPGFVDTSCQKDKPAEIRSAGRCC